MLGEVSGGFSSKVLQNLIYAPFSVDIVQLREFEKVFTQPLLIADGQLTG